MPAPLQRPGQPAADRAGTIGARLCPRSAAAAQSVIRCVACPRCQQTDAGFWVSCPVVPWDRYTAIARAARAAAVPGDGTTGSTAWGAAAIPAA